MLGTDALRDAHQSSVDFERIDFAKWREHLAEFEAYEARGMAGDADISFHNFFIRLMG